MVVWCDRMVRLRKFLVTPSRTIESMETVGSRQLSELFAATFKDEGGDPEQRQRSDAHHQQGREIGNPLFQKDTPVRRDERAHRIRIQIQLPAVLWQVRGGPEHGG